MKICLIGKYIPIQGGVSKDNQWLSYVLAQAGWDVYVVTNAEEVEPAYRCLSWSTFPPPPEHCSGMILVHSTARTERRQYIPYANPFVTKLAAIAADVITTYGCDVIYSYYLEPFDHLIQVHLAGGYWRGSWLVDSHSEHVSDEMLALFHRLVLQCRVKGVILEHDQHFPSMNVLLAQLERACEIMGKSDVSWPVKERTK